MKIKGLLSSVSMGTVKNYVGYITIEDPVFLECFGEIRYDTVPQSVTVHLKNVDDFDNVFLFLDKEIEIGVDVMVNLSLPQVEFMCKIK